MSDAHGQPQIAYAATARVRQGDFSTENGTLQLFAFEHGLEKNQAVSDNSLFVHFVYEFFNCADLAV
jgi:hypothetical protein